MYLKNGCRNEIIRPENTSPETCFSRNWDADQHNHHGRFQRWRIKIFLNTLFMREKGFCLGNKLISLVMGSISPTCLHAAFTSEDLNRQSSQQCLSALLESLQIKRWLNLPLGSISSSFHERLLHRAKKFSKEKSQIWLINWYNLYPEMVA